jgi:hypothetical protein
MLNCHPSWAVHQSSDRTSTVGAFASVTLLHVPHTWSPASMVHYFHEIPKKYKPGPAAPEATEVS